jgi:hypothetical protein
MSRTTPPRPLDIEALFPELAAHRGTCTRLHPRPGTPTPYESSVGGPLLWPVDEPWPTCEEAHPKHKGYRIEDIRRSRRGESRTALDRAHEVPGLGPDTPVPLLAVVQLYTRDVPDLPAPPGRDLLQLLWCPFEAHGTPPAPAVHLRWRTAADCVDVRTDPPLPEVVGFEGCVPEPCVLHPEPGVVEHEWAELLDEGLQSRIEAWEEELWEENEGGYEDEGDALGYDADFSVAAGWKVGGFATWGSTGPYPVGCPCGTPMRLLLAIRPSEHDGTASWIPEEDRDLPDLGNVLTPTHVRVGRGGTLNVFHCPADPTHAHRTVVQG